VNQGEKEGEFFSVSGPILIGFFSEKRKKRKERRKPQTTKPEKPPPLP